MLALAAIILVLVVTMVALAAIILVLAVTMLALAATMLVLAVTVLAPVDTIPGLLLQGRNGPNMDSRPEARCVDKVLGLCAAPRFV